MELDEAAFALLLKGSPLGALPRETLRAMLAHHQVIRTPAQAMLYSEEEAPRITLLLEGLLRVGIASRDGREMTLRYERQGEFIGIPALLIGPAAVRVSAMTDCRICYFHAEAIRAMAERNAALALALGRECAFNLYDLIARTAAATFGTVRQRLIRDLLDLATEQDGALRVALTAGELAAAIGSVREVVARTLSHLRAEGLIQTGRGAITLLDPAALRGEIAEPASAAV